MFSEKTEGALKSSMLKKIGNTVDKSENSLVHDTLSPAAIELANFYMQLSIIANKQDIENLSGSELDRFVYQRTMIERKEGTQATAQVTISGSEGTVVKIGTLVGTGDLNFVVMEEATIPVSGTVNVIVEAQKVGAAGNVGANTIVKFPEPIQGLVDVYNAEAATGGYEPETDAELKQRYYDKLQKPGKAGNKYHYEEWAKDVVGVGDVKVYPLWDGPLTVKVVIIDSNRRPPDPELVQSVTDYIESKRPFGAIVTVEGATPKTIDVSVTLTIAEGYLLEDVKATVEVGITEYLESLAFVEYVVSWAKIGGVIIGTDGVLDYQNLTVNLGTENIALLETEVPVLGTVTAT